MAYAPKPIYDSSLPGLVRYLQDELLAIAQSQNEFSVSMLVLETQYVEPTRKIHGIVALADGTSWNPGSGKGVYWYDSGTASWKLLG